MLRALVLLMMAGLSAAGVRAEELPFRIVVHPSNPVASMSRAELSAIYMKRTRSWRDGREILAVDQPSTSRIREQFSRAVHGKSVSYVTRYWQRLIFSGRAVPPRELRSDAAVLKFVTANAEGIGYVGKETLPGDGVKVIAVTP
jgi:ABC-type phosphate transport system substrate-binding protein